jgi:hypothetical protein
VSAPFEIQPHDERLDKTFRIEGPDDLTLYVDNDDVDSAAVHELAERLVDLLNDGWERSLRDRVLTIGDSLAGATSALELLAASGAPAEQVVENQRLVLERVATLLREAL